MNFFLLNLLLSCVRQHNGKKLRVTRIMMYHHRRFSSSSYPHSLTQKKRMMLIFAGGLSCEDFQERKKKGKVKKREPIYYPVIKTPGVPSGTASALSLSLSLSSSKKLSVHHYNDIIAFQDLHSAHCRRLTSHKQNIFLIKKCMMCTYLFACMYPLSYVHFKWKKTHEKKYGSKQLAVSGSAVCGDAYLPSITIISLLVSKIMSLYWKRFWTSQRRI